MPITINFDVASGKDLEKPGPLVVFNSDSGRKKTAQAISARTNDFLRKAVDTKDDMALMELARALININDRRERRLKENTLDHVLEGQ